MSHSEKIAYTEVFKLGTPLVEESLYYVFGDRTHPDNSESLTILNGGYEIYKPNFELRRKSVPYYVIEFPVNGQGYLEINGKEHILEKGVVAGYKPGDAHYYRSNPEMPLEHYFINFSGHDADYLFEESSLKSNYIIKLEEFEYSKRLMVNILKTAFNKDLHSFELCNSYLRTFLLELCNKFDSTKGTESLAKSKYIECMKYIDKNYLNIVSVENAADALNITTRYISKLFSKYGQTNAYQYITGLKMIRATELLLTTMMSVKKIGESIGYHDQYHFCKRFKSFYGISPTNYRKKYLNLNTE